jgi:hypothetical protein
MPTKYLDVREVPNTVWWKPLVNTYLKKLRHKFIHSLVCLTTDP